MFTERGAGRMGGRDSEGVWDRHAHTAIFKMDKQGLPGSSVVNPLSNAKDICGFDTWLGN